MPDNNCGGRIGRGSFVFKSKPLIIGFAAVGGTKEKEGPLGEFFDRTFSDNLCGEDSWEKAESCLQQEAVNLCIAKSGLTAKDYDVIYSGDLLNQCMASTFGMRSLMIPHIGMYGACSTMASSLITAAAMIESGGADRCIAVTSSHFSSSERQFRMPLQYGGQRTPTAQWTVTGAGAVALSNSENYMRPDMEFAAGGSGNVLKKILEEKRSDDSGNESLPSPQRSVYIAGATIGIIEDLGVTDVTNMGAAMSPAAASTIQRYLTDHSVTVSDFDLILTGDLGFVGSELLIELLQREGIDISAKHNDGGMLIYDREKQDVHAGGSGCGCSASALCADVIPRMIYGQLNRVLFIATGALMSPTSSFQGESIPSVAHAVELCVS